MEITNNGYTAKVLNFGSGEYALLISDLVKLDGHVFTEFYRKLKNKFVLDKYKRHAYGCTRKNTALTLDGCIAICEMFREPNDSLINEIKKIQERFDVKEPKIEKKIPAEQLVDLEMKRLENEKLDFGKLEERVSLLEVKTNDMMVNASLSKSHFQDCITKIDDRLMDIENSLSYINDKPNQQDTSFRTLLKECIKEIIKEELQK